MAYKQSKNPFGKSPLNFNSPLNSFDSLVGKLMNQGKSKEAATKIAGKVANAKMKGAGSGPTAAQKARAKGSPAKQAKPDFLDLDKDGNTTEPMKDAAKSSPANLKEKSPAKLKSPAEKKLVGKQKNLPEGLKKAIEAAPESPAKMKSPMKKHSDAHIRKEAKRIARKNKGDEQDIYYELKSKYAQEKKDAAKKAKDDAKGSPAKKVDDMTKAEYEKAKKISAERRKAKGLEPIDIPYEKRGQKPAIKKAVKTAVTKEKAKAKAKADKAIKAKYPKGSPAKNKVEGLSHDQLASKSSKGYKRHMEMHKSADKRIKKEGGKATKIIKDRKKTADLLNAKNPPSAKTRLEKSGVKANSPANLKGVVKGAEKVAKIVKRAKPQQIARQAKLAAISGETAIRSAMAGAAGYLAGKAGIGSDKRAKTGIISSKKKSPLNNAYENPEYFVPTKSSYGQDMDNFFNTVGEAYDKTQSANFNLDNMSDQDILDFLKKAREVKDKNNENK